MRELATALLRLLASLKLAVVLLVGLAVVLLIGILVDIGKGPDYARWYVYDSQWFVVLLGLLALNIMASMIIRFPWKLSQIGFLTVHVGLLLLLFGAVLTLSYGIEGTLALEEGKSSDEIVLRNTSRFMAQWMAKRGQKDDQVASFAFRPGPVDWSEKETLAFPEELNGIRLKVLRYLAHARMNEDWVADPENVGAPAMKCALTGPEDASAGESWLVAGPSGAEAAAGSTRIDFFKTGMSSLVDDFLHTPKDMDSSGVLAIHYDGRVERVPVSKNIGKTISLPGSKVTVELAGYFPNAKPTADAHFMSQGDEPKNPVLELLVHVPGKKEPLRQNALAQKPMVSFDMVHGQSCPVKFWYHHPKMKPEPGVEFLAAPDGKLYCRLSSEGKYQPRGEVKQGDRIETWGKSFITVVRFVPHAKQEVSFVPVEMSGEEGEDVVEAAAQVEITAGGAARQLWLQRNGQEQTPQIIETKAGKLGVTFDFDTLPLPFSLRLVKFTHGLNPGGVGDASYASMVQILNESHQVSGEQEISMNQPLTNGKFTFYQSGMLPGDSGTVLSAACDPGKHTKYAGSLLICLGCCLMLFKRVNFFDRLSAFPSQKST